LAAAWVGCLLANAVRVRRVSPLYNKRKIQVRGVRPRYNYQVLKTKIFLGKKSSAAAPDTS